MQTYSIGSNQIAEPSLNTKTETQLELLAEAIFSINETLGDLEKKLLPISVHNHLPVAANISEKSSQTSPLYARIEILQGKVSDTYYRLETLYNSIDL